MKTEGFKYYAFISYSHKDKKLVKKLQRHLQSYHLPSALLKSNPNLPKKISPVFMDESNLVAPGTLKEALRDNLDNSNYLIVICSPNSAKSEYVNDEVKYFIEQGRVNHIVPFIIDGIPHAEDASVECFPRAILELPKEHELLGIDMKKFGARDSFSRVIATLLSLDLDNFVNYEHRRRMRRLAAFSSMAAVIMIAAGVFIWRNIIPHIKYYHTYVYRWEKPVGLFEVKESERSKKEYTYRFTTVGGKVRTIERINSAGVLVDPSIITPFTELPMIRFVSDRTVEYYDVNGNKVYRKEYTKNFEAADFYRGDEDVPYAVKSNTPDSYSVNKYDHAMGSREIPGNIIRLTFEYDNNGYVIREMFRLNNHGGDDNRGVNVLDSKGRGGFKYTVDDMGRVTEVRYLNKNRDMMSVGGAYVEYIEYEASPYPTEIVYTDNEDYIIPNSKGVSTISIIYDKYFNAKMLGYFDDEDAKVMNTNENMSSVLLLHDSDNGFLIWESFYDVNINPCECREGYQSIKFARDKEGRITERFLYDLEGRRITNSDDIADNDAQKEYLLGIQHYTGLKNYYLGKDELDNNFKKAFEHFMNASEKGHASAQNILGGMYEKGEGVEQDYVQAAYWYKKAAEQGNSEAQSSLALIYKNGYGVEQDYKQAVYWWTQASEQGYASAQFYLGLMYQGGYGVRQSYEQAVYWYTKAAEKGDAGAQNNLGLMYEDSKGVRQNYKQAVYWYQKAAEQGFTKAQHNLGSMYEDGKGVEQDYRKAVQWYQRAAGKGHSSSQNSLGLMYEYGKGVKQDYKQAVYWYRKAAEQGDESAQCNLGLMYYKGLGVEQDYKQAAYWLKRGADQRSEVAQFNLGSIYYEGEGFEQDYKQALYWYQKAAELGYSRAQFNLGIMYEKGYGVKQDYRLAVQWYQKAAEKGHSGAQNNLGSKYYNGHGVEKNLQAAYMWYYLSYLSGEKAAEGNLNAFQGKLTEAQMNEAKSQAQKKFNEIKEKNK